jgi:mono/diheme cytochrome c family protein
MRRLLAVSVLALPLMGATSSFGGWAVISVENLPEFLVAGQSTEISFTVLQHGQTPMNDLKPTVLFRQNGERRLLGRRSVNARRGTDPGVYLATFTLPDTGQVEITIDANWHTARITLEPLRVVRTAAAAAALAPTERGRDLFVARGCVSCHMKRDDKELGNRADVRLAPDLTGRGFEREWLAAKLADPARNRVRFSEWVEMPNLGLNEREITALVSYLNRPAAEASPESGS